jgi:hypothetical protein
MLDYFKKFEMDNEEDYNGYKSAAINLGHAELTAQAYYLGFSKWKDLTYPLTGQYVLTNGEYFSLAKYQLNTLRLWNKSSPLSNLCYITKPEKYLFNFRESTFN